MRFDAGVDGGLDGGPDGGGCPASAQYCVGRDLFQCEGDGRTKALIETCTDFCDGELGCVRCFPGSGRCDDGWSTRCAWDGSHYDRVRDCEAAGSTCGPSGFCEDACGDAERRDGNLGCRFTAVPLLLPNTVREWSPFRVIVANPAAGEVATVRIVRGDEEVASERIDPGEQMTFDLEWIEEMSFRLGDPGDRRWESFVVADAAYHVVSTLPVTVFQMAPGNGNLPTVEASLLLPQHSLSGDFYALSWEPLSKSRLLDYAVPGYIAVAPAGVDPVTVRVEPTVDVLGASDHWPSIEAGRPFEFTLDVGEVAHVLPSMPPRCERAVPGAERGTDNAYYCRWPDHDLTGTALHASGPLATFGGHMGAIVPIPYFASDPLEEQLPPVQTWGRRFVVVPLDDFERLEVPARNVVRVVASRADTSLSITPTPDGFETVVLQSGEFFEILLSEPSLIEGSAPVLVAQYLTGGQLSGTFRGDPALLVVPPVEQYRRDYTFSAPEEPVVGLPGLDDYVLLVRAKGAPVELDGVAVDTGWSALGEAMEWHVRAVTGGAHAAASEAPMGLVSFGVGSAAAYAYAGGTDLRPIPLE